MENENKNINKNTSEITGKKPHIIMFLVSIISYAIFCFASIFYLDDLYMIYRNMIIAGICYSAIFFIFEESWLKEYFLFDNKEFYFRFAILELIGTIVSVILPLLPIEGWPYIILFVFLYLLSNEILGIVTASSLLLFSIILTETTSNYSFFLYFISGMIAIAAFSCLDEKYVVSIPIIVSIFGLIVNLCINTVFFDEDTFTLDKLMVPAINVLICILLFFIFLKLFSVYVVHRIRDRYMEINDPECILLTKLKEQSKDEYFHAIHTAYLCDRIAKKLNLNDCATKACGYYHRIGIIKGSNSWDNIQSICIENNFPKSVISILGEYVDKKKPIMSKETVVLLFSDTIVSSIMYLFSKDEKAILDYEKLIDTVFTKKMESSILNYSEISISDLRIMRETFIEEKLYYDFLR